MPMPKLPQAVESIDPRNTGELPIKLDRIIRSAQHGDAGAFESLMRYYAPLVTAYFYSRAFDQDEAEDLFQETFFTVYRELRHLRGPEHIGPWLMRIARSKWVDLIRKQKVQRDRMVEFATEVRSASANPQLIVRQNPRQLSEDQELGALLAAAIGRTGERYRVILTLSLIEERTPMEIAELLGLKGSTVRMRLRRGLKRLHNCLRASGLILDASWYVQ